jgi:hypothetical protein
VSDWSPGQAPLCPEWLAPALLLLVLAPVALVKLLGGSWGQLGLGVVVLLVVAGLLVLGRLVYVRVQGRRA